MLKLQNFIQENYSVLIFNGINFEKVSYVYYDNKMITISVKIKNVSHEGFKNFNKNI